MSRQCLSSARSEEFGAKEACIWHEKPQFHKGIACSTQGAHLVEQEPTVLTLSRKASVLITLIPPLIA